VVLLRTQALVQQGCCHPLSNSFGIASTCTGTIGGRLAAVRRLAYEAADSGLLCPDLAAGIRRVKGPKSLGVRPGNWLSANEAKALWRAPDPNALKGKRDRALPGVLLGCGLRRKEAAELGIAHLQRRQDHWVIVGLAGKARQIWDSARSGSGQERNRFLACIRWGERRPCLPVRLPRRKAMGKRRNGAGDMGCRQGVRSKGRH
jgi:integrase